MARREEASLKVKLGTSPFYIAPLISSIEAHKKSLEALKKCFARMEQLQKGYLSLREVYQIFGSYGFTKSEIRRWLDFYTKVGYILRNHERIYLNGGIK